MGGYGSGGSDPYGLLFYHPKKTSLCVVRGFVMPPPLANLYLNPTRVEGTKIGLPKIKGEEVNLQGGNRTKKIDYRIEKNI